MLGFRPFKKNGTKTEQLKEIIETEEAILPEQAFAVVHRFALLKSERFLR
ncbi:MAG: hypothetical protein GY754_11920 [bacterium]|nr:hypothetical protein [bacterium]